MTDITAPDGWREKLEGLAGRRRDLVGVGSVVIALVVVVVALEVRSPEPQIAPPATTTIPVAQAPTSAVVFVHVSGAVRNPGLYELPQGARVDDAVVAAGGARPGAAVGALNLAEIVVDGAKVSVPRRGDGPQMPLPATTPVPTATVAPVDLNTADATALEAIPGIGPVRAGAIVEHRDKNGPYPSVESLIEVSGIGPATLETVRPYLSV